MRRTAASSRPGSFAMGRFRTWRRAWLKRFWWALPLVAVVELGLVVGFGAVLQPEHLTFYVGVGVGIASTTVVALVDSPPAHIERWRRGAEGEQATGKQLRKLESQGWTSIHDLDTGRGNIDHVAVGPPGVFLFDSKSLGGAASVTQGVLSVRWIEDADEGYESRLLAARMRGAAGAVSRALAESGLPAMWVQPAVVLWSRFDQKAILSKQVAWIRGTSLADVLIRRPPVLSEAEVERVANVLRSGDFADACRRS